MIEVKFETLEEAVEFQVIRKWNSSKAHSGGCTSMTSAINTSLFAFHAISTITGSTAKTSLPVRKCLSLRLQK